jgi:ERCC4-related helicase
MPLPKDALVLHPRFGRGRVRMDDGETLLVRFDGGLEECLAGDLQPLDDLEDRAAGRTLDAPLPVVARVLASAIWSVNRTWGVFSSSRISLLPHQLWVCKRVIEAWPTRWLVADDVGLGKTIEAGLILTPLMASGRVKRLLILAPASLTAQWQTRLLEMFDIRLSVYSTTNDNGKGDYWNAHDRVLASAQTLRLDRDGRWDRLLQAEPWDMVMVDEAHHLHADEGGGATLAFRLVERLQAQGRVRSMVLFTGTPHRGKDYGFLALLRLLRPGEFDPRAPLRAQAHLLPGVMIRNNKQRVTTMRGERVFTPVVNFRETYRYSPAEGAFYDLLTEFIGSGKAYASRLKVRERRTAMLVLITMQKLASSSVAAVRRALSRRLHRLRDAEARVERAGPELERLRTLVEEDDPANLDEIARLEEELADRLSDAVQLSPDEIPALEELLAAAEAVVDETKIQRILQVIDERFSGRSVLLFTEYKATQARVMAALQARFGHGCVAFINGDGEITGALGPAGERVTLRADRAWAAQQFNRRMVRFLVSTEAAGEGIDLQESCSALIHVDLPWNPMRLHQRVGRLSRYGQSEVVEVVTVRNPDTVESRIWECLDDKLQRITLAFQGGMEDPEDMRQLVLGMASTEVFRDIFADADAGLRGERLAQWFNSRTATFGGKDAVDLVRGVFGNVARFDFGEVAAQIPRVDLPDLLPFFKTVLAVLGKRPAVQADERRLTLKTPKEWMTDYTIMEQYELLFSRAERPRPREDIAGIGLRVVDRALLSAIERPESLCVLGGLDAPLVVFAVRDRVTGTDGAVNKVVVGLSGDPQRGWTLLRDWEIVKHLNPLAEHPRARSFSAPGEPPPLDVPGLIRAAEGDLVGRLAGLGLPFQVPVAEALACLLPAEP